MRFPSILARQQMAPPNFRGRPSEASRATWTRDRPQLPFFLCNPSGKMTCKIWPAKSGLAVTGSLNVRDGLANIFEAASRHLFLAPPAAGRDPLTASVGQLGSAAPQAPLIRTKSHEFCRRGAIAHFCIACIKKD